MFSKTCYYPIRVPMVLAVILSAMIFSTSAAYGATSNFILNFQPNPGDRLGDPEWLNFSCNRGGGGSEDFEDCNDNDELRDNNGRDRTAFLMERLRGDGRDEYFHVVIGLPGDDFVQEVYIKVTSRLCNGDCDDLGPITDSLGESRDITEVRNNAYDPRGPANFSGNGTANPKSTLFRQLMTDASGGMTQDFIKAEFNQKHLLNFTLDAGFVDMDFRLNMTNSTFDDANTAGTLELNRLINSDPLFDGIPDLVSGFPPTSVPTSDNFDAATDGDLVDVTGGKYRFVSHGIYEGEGAGFDIFAADWNDFFDPAQNVGHLYGPEGGGN